MAKTEEDILGSLHLHDQLKIFIVIAHELCLRYNNFSLSLAKTYWIDMKIVHFLNFVINRKIRTCSQIMCLG